MTTRDFDGSKRRGNSVGFSVGTALLAVGVTLQVPDVLERARADMAGPPMSMSPLMSLGMVCEVIGLAVAATALCRGNDVQSAREPARDSGREPARRKSVRLPVVEYGKFTRRYWATSAVLAMALVIDIMKPLTVGFVMPGMRREYGLSPAVVSWLLVVALIGTVVGSVLWGIIGDRYGRRTAFLLATLLFVATSACGAMPGFAYNLVMCFLMGSSAGGLLPLVFTLAAELTPGRHRGWITVLIGGIGGIGGYLAASGAAYFLEPAYGWRCLWLIGLPTGLLLVGLRGFVPESPLHLLRIGHRAEAVVVLRCYGARLSSQIASRPDAGAAFGGPSGTRGRLTLLLTRYPGVTAVIGLLGLVWGLVNFGFLVLLPSHLIDQGYAADTVRGLLAHATVLAVPGLVVVVVLYGFWNRKHTLVLWTLGIAAALAGIAYWSLTSGGGLALTASVGLLVLALSAVNAMLVPYSAEIYPTALRATGTGVVGATTKLGGVLGPPFMAISAVGPEGLAAPALVLAVLLLTTCALLSRKCPRTSRRESRLPAWARLSGAQRSGPRWEDHRQGRIHTAGGEFDER